MLSCEPEHYLPHEITGVKKLPHWMQKPHQCILSILDHAFVFMSDIQYGMPNKTNLCCKAP